MKLCILETDRPAEAFLPAHGTYAGMFERWLTPVLPEATFRNIFIAGGEALPDDPDLFDAYLVTGSSAGVYEQHPWIAPLEAFLRELRTRNRPVAGVCFGHQVMAQAYGGKVEKSAAGWVLGRQDHTLSPEGASFFGTDQLAALSFHQDQITALPPGTARLMSNDSSPNGGLVYTDFPAISVQFHPEFQPDYIHDLLIAYQGDRVPIDRALNALATLDGTLDNDRVARGFAEFFRRNVKKK